MKTLTNLIHLRPMVPRDLPQVMVIETAGFAHAWGEGDFRRVLRRHTCSGTVAYHGSAVVGFSVDEMREGHYHLLNLAVHPNWLRKGVGTRLVTCLKDQLTRRRRVITADVRETNLVACVFLRSQAFRAVKVVRDAYPDTGESCYEFSYSLGE